MTAPNWRVVSPGTIATFLDRHTEKAERTRPPHFHASHHVPMITPNNPAHLAAEVVRAADATPSAICAGRGQSFGFPSIESFRNRRLPRGVGIRVRVKSGGHRAVTSMQRCACDTRNRRQGLRLHERAHPRDRQRQRLRAHFGVGRHRPRALCANSQKSVCKLGIPDPADPLPRWANPIAGTPHLGVFPQCGGSLPVIRRRPGPGPGVVA